MDTMVDHFTPLALRVRGNNAIMHHICAQLGLPPEPEKVEGPATTISFTAIEIDSVAMELGISWAG